MDEPFITLKEAGQLLAMDLFSILRISKTKKGPRLRTIRVSPRCRRTKVSWIEEYLRELNPELPPAKALAIDIPGARERARRAAIIDRELKARGYGRGRRGPRRPSTDSETK